MNQLLEIKQKYNERIDILKTMIQNGERMKLICKTLGISRQRVYNLMALNNLATYRQIAKRKVEIKGDKQKWLWRITSSCCRRKDIKEERYILYEALKDNLPDTCPILPDIVLNYVNGTRWNRDQSPSLDRIDNKKGYIPGNVHIISWRANRLKSDGTPEEHKKIAEYIQSLNSPFTK